MDELNLKEIEKKLNHEFDAGQRLIFWYDSEASFEDCVNQLELGNAQILRLTKRNAFRTKMLLEHEDTEGKYLIYAPFEKPPVFENHLEDTLMYSREFYADRLSLIAADIGLPTRLRGSLKKLAVFFGIGRKNLKAEEKRAGIQRTNAFIEYAKKMELSAADEETLLLIAMCVVSKARNITVDDFIYSVFAYGDIREQKIISEMKQNELEQEFWILCKKRFGYSDPKPALLKFVLSLFAVYTCKDHLSSVPQRWEIFVQDAMKRKASNVAVLLENMMNSMIYQENFDILSEIASEELQAEETFHCLPQEELLHLASFSLVDDLLIRWMIDRELAEDKNASISGFLIPDICTIRSKLHFGIQKKAEYAAILAGYHLLSVMDFVPAKELKDLIESYCRVDYQIDSEYRRFIAALDTMEDKSDFESLYELIQNIYITDYLEKIVYQWNVSYEKNAGCPMIENQKNFYHKKVASIKEKVAVIISDGFRYEAAKELEARLSENENLEVEMSAMLSSLPAITMICMGQLLPHEKIEMTRDEKPKVYLDGRPCATTVQRENILKSANQESAAIDYDSVRAMSTKQLKEFSAGKKVIYVYHNKIDATGENLKTENNVFDAVERSIDEIFDLVWKLSKRGNVYRFVITADHGFIYTRKKLDATDKLENQAGRNAFTDRRFIIDSEPYVDDGIYTLSLGESLDNSDSRQIMLAKGMSVFKCGGGMNYVHGGGSPQEMIVPSIFVKAQKGLVAVEDAKLNLITDIRKVTNLNLRLDFYQEQPVSSLVKAMTYKIRFEADTGEIISNEVIYKADSLAEKPGERIITLCFDIKKKAYGHEHKYFLKILKEKERLESEVLSRQIIMDLPFTDDFGFDI